LKEGKLIPTTGSGMSNTGSSIVRKTSEPEIMSPTLKIIIFFIWQKSKKSNTAYRDIST
jgi:hypothetical protein